MFLLHKKSAVFIFALPHVRNLLRMLKKLDKLGFAAIPGTFYGGHWHRLICLLYAIYVAIHRRYCRARALDFFVMIELIYYSILSFIPLAFPVGEFCLASVMVFGGMSEKYELASCKSAGIPLLQNHASINYISQVLLALFRYLASNYIIPI